MRVNSWALMALLCTGCGGAPDVDDVGHEETGALRAASESRPAGWQAHSHEQRDRADYARLFDDTRVQRIDIEISAAAYARMVDDLNQRVGGPGTRNRSPMAIAACQERVENDPCAFLDVVGTCTPSGSGIACEALDQQGPLDLVPGDPISVPVTLRYDDAVWNRVALRFKGNSSLSSAWRSGRRKLPLRLDFDSFEDEHPEISNQRFFGFDEMTFAPAYSDPSFIREKLASDLLRQEGLKAARAAFYRVFIDTGEGPEYWGLYTMLEDPSDQLPAEQFADGSGNLYKPDGVGADFTHFDQSGFEKKSNEKRADYGDVQRAIAALHAPRDDAAAWRRGLEAVFDVETFLHTLAVTRAIDHWDSYGQNAHNYYLYGDPTQNGRLVWISWDHNLTFSGGRGRSSILLGTTSKSWPLIHFLLEDPVYRARYSALLAQVVAGSFEKSRFDALATTLHAQVAPYVLGPEGEQLPYTHLRNAQSFTNALPGLIAAANGRRAAIVDALQREAAARAPKPAAETQPDGSPQVPAPPSPSEPAPAESTVSPEPSMAEAPG